MSAIPNAVNQLHRYATKSNDQDALDLANLIPGRSHPAWQQGAK
jgi:hypothetical protein